MKTTLDSFMSGPRWARCDLFIKKLCSTLGIECEVERETSFLRETVFFKVTGETYRLKIFIDTLDDVVKERNGE